MIMSSGVCYCKQKETALHRIQKTLNFIQNNGKNLRMDKNTYFYLPLGVSPSIKEEGYSHANRFNSPGESYRYSSISDHLRSLSFAC